MVEKLKTEIETVTNLKINFSQDLDARQKEVERLNKTIESIQKEAQDKEKEYNSTICRLGE